MALGLLVAVSLPKRIDFSKPRPKPRLRRLAVMPEPATQEIYFNQWDPEFRANPYPYYKVMLAGPPRIINITIPATPDLLKMLAIEGAGITEIPLPTALPTRYQDCLAILRDPQHFSSARPPQEQKFEDRGPFKGATTMLFSDPPVNTRLRK